jgi:acyl-coenzyme A synthetase/AMP-(fatty) acid ligase
MESSTSADDRSLITLHVAKSFQGDLRTAEEEVMEDGRLEQATICAPEHYVDEQDRNVLILHSSGTTGLPKAIFQPHKYLLGYACCHIRTDEEDMAALNMSTLPLYHVRNLPTVVGLHRTKPKNRASV